MLSASKTIDNRFVIFFISLESLFLFENLCKDKKETIEMFVTSLKRC